MVPIKDVITGILGKYYWGIVLVLGLVGLLLLVVIPNTEFIMTRLGFETKTSLREERNKLLESVSVMENINKKNSEEMVLLKQRYEKQLEVVQSNHNDRIIVQEKVKVIKEKIPLPIGNTTTVEEAKMYYQVLNEAYVLANGDLS